MYASITAELILIFFYMELYECIYMKSSVAELWVITDGYLFGSHADGRWYENNF